MSRTAPLGLMALAILSMPLSAAGQTPESEFLSLDSLLNIRINAAAKYEQTTSEAAASTSVVTREDIDRFGWRNLAEVLSSLGGFYFTSDRAFSYLGTRGFARPSDHNNRVLLLVDGRPWNDIINAQAGIAEGRGVPLDHVDRIEVVRGPGSALYGSSAMLAVVNVITRTTKDGDGPRVRLEGGGDGLRNGSLSVAGRAGSAFEYSAFAGWHQEKGADIYFPEFDVPGVSNGRAVGKSHREGYQVGGRLTRGSLSLSVVAEGSDHGDPTAPYGSSFERPKIDMGDRLDVHITYATSLSSRVRGRASIDYLNSDVDSTIPFDEPQPVDALARLHGERWRGEAELMIDVSPAHRLIVGGGASTVDPNLRIGNTFQGFNARLGERVNVASVFAQHEWQARADLSIVAGARVDRYSTVGSALSPRGAVVYHPSGATTLKFLYGVAFRAPTPLEQFIEEPGRLIANPDLRPEKIRTAELVWEQRLGAGLYATASAYDYQMMDLISQGVDAEQGVLTYQNLASVRGRGIGLEITGRAANGGTFYMSGTLQQTSDEVTNQSLVNSPSHLFRAGGSALLPRGFRFSATLARDGARNTYRGAPTEGVWLAGMHLRSPTVGGLQASFSVRNLFDADYRYPAGLEHRQVAIPQTGRSFRLALTASF